LPGLGNMSSRFRNPHHLFDIFATWLIGGLSWPLKHVKDQIIYKIVVDKSAKQVAHDLHK